MFPAAGDPDEATQQQPMKLLGGRVLLRESDDEECSCVTCCFRPITIHLGSALLTVFSLSCSFYHLSKSFLLLSAEGRCHRVPLKAGDQVFCLFFFLRRGVFAPLPQNKNLSMK